ncbi:MAG: TIGR01777 family oxidoreductase, partial [Bacteroidetes bacterium]|nr:TIGR01777 family oxidoreductase [Bacteroidota bacterium]
MPVKSSAKKKPAILITGGSGHLGRLLTDELLSRGYEVSQLNRKPGTDNRVKTWVWDVANGQIDERCVEGIDIVVHLAGESIAGKKWTGKRKKAIVDSRTKSIELLYRAMQKRPNKINTIISASAIGYYGDRGDELLSEDAAPGKGFMADCCIAWEKAVDEGRPLGVRIVKFRTGVVLDKNSGALPQLAKPVKLLAGSPLGSGRQWVPWIHWRDAVKMYIYAIENIHLTGTYNMVSPEPVTNATLVKEIAHRLHKPLWLPNVPAFMLKLLLGEMSDMVLYSTKVSAQMIVSDGFQFEYPNLA